MSGTVNLVKGPQMERITGPGVGGWDLNDVISLNGHTAKLCQT